MSRQEPAEPQPMCEGLTSDRPKDLAIEVTTEWAGSTLGVRQLSRDDARQFLIGTTKDCDVWVECSGSREALVTLLEDRVRLLIPGQARLNLSGRDVESVLSHGPYRVGNTVDPCCPRRFDLPLEEEWFAAVTLGNVVFRIKPTSRERPPQARRLASIDLWCVAFVFLSVAVHLLILAASFIIPPEPHPLCGCWGCLDCAGPYERFFYEPGEPPPRYPATWIDDGDEDHRGRWVRWVPAAPICSDDPEAVLDRMASPLIEQESLLVLAHCSRRGGRLLQQPQELAND